MPLPPLRKYYLQKSISNATLPGETLKVLEEFYEVIRAVLLEVQYNHREEDGWNQEIRNAIVFMWGSRSYILDLTHVQEEIVRVVREIWLLINHTIIFVYLELRWLLQNKPETQKGKYLGWRITCCILIILGYRFVGHLKEDILWTLGNETLELTRMKVSRVWPHINDHWNNKTRLKW